ncbi:MAG: hypothetical protein ACOC6N_03725, partial [archaeon]
VLQVLRTDPGKEQIDLSLRRVNQDDKRKKLEEWKKARKAETLLTQVAHDLGRDVEELYESEANKIVEEYGSLYEGLEAASKQGAPALTQADVSDEIAEILSTIAKDKIVIKGVTIQGLIEMTSLHSDGVDDIKMAFVEAESVAEENDASIEITTLGAPRYRIELTADDYKRAEIVLDKTVTSIRENWEDVEGTFSYSRE